MSDEDDTGTNFGYLRMTPAEELAARLGADGHISKSEVAVFLVRHPPDDWPQALTDHVVALLEGRAKGPRGRPKKKHTGIEDARIQMFYPSILRALQGKTDNLPKEFVEGV